MYIKEQLDFSEEKISEYVHGKFFRLINPFLSWLKKGETYWMEYLGDGKYEIRSDNNLHQKFNMTSFQLLTNFFPVDYESDFISAMQHFHLLGVLGIHKGRIEQIIEFYLNFYKEESKKEMDGKDLNEVLSEWFYWIRTWGLLHGESNEDFCKRQSEIASDDVKATFWKEAKGKYLPEYDREVIAIDKIGKVVYAHRPYPDGWNGRNILTGEIHHYVPKTYDEGGWNIPNLEWWLDLNLPKNKDNYEEQD